jgi:hypothetical protein
MKKIILMLILFTNLCLYSNQIMNYSFDGSINNLRFQGLLAYHQGETYKAHKLLTSYLQKAEPHEDDWKTYVIFHLINRDLERCDFTPINKYHNDIIRNTDWNNKIEEIYLRCGTKKEGSF